MELIPLIIPTIFILGYLCIAIEHRLSINKAAPAVLTGFLIWTFLSTQQGDTAVHEFGHHVGEIAEILFFLLGAMMVVEMIDSHQGFEIITNTIRLTNRVSLYWVIGWLTFFLSAALDNMTTAIVMSALLRKLIEDKRETWVFAGIVIIAANAGGAWSPIGDITTIMLWMGGQVSSGNIIAGLFIPSVASLIIPLIWFSVRNRGHLVLKSEATNPAHNGETSEGGTQANLREWEKRLILIVGLLSLLLVPVFKNYTHLPPFMGIMGGLGLMWVITEIFHHRHPDHEERERRKHITAASILKKIDHASILFFLGILVAVAGLQTGGYLKGAAHFLDERVGNVYIINTMIGLLSAIVDNVPLVAAAMGMYPLDMYPQDHIFWELLALCAGTGGSILIIGSAAGVAVMGILNINFSWYLKNIALPALLGYLASIGTFWLQQNM